MKLKTISLAAVAFSAFAGTSQAAVTFSGIANNTGFTVDGTTPLDHCECGCSMVGRILGLNG